MAFIRRREDFRCAVCGTAVHGTGYTDHCPKCLWSMHVDMEPGDRASECHGMMRPVHALLQGGVFTIDYLCDRCGAKKSTKAAPEDSRDVITSLAGPYGLKN